MKPHTSASIRALIGVIMKPSARSDENEACTDNAVAAAVKFARFCGDAMPAEQREGIMAHALTYFPIKGDEIEARLLHGWLTDGLMNNDPLWLGAGGSRAKALLETLAKIRQAHEENEEKDEERLLEEAQEAKLVAWGAAVRQGPGAAQLGGMIAKVDAKWRPLLSRWGLC